MNFWTYIRETCPALCTIHSIRLFPDDEIYVNIMNFLHEKTTYSKNHVLSYATFLQTMSTYIAGKIGVLSPHVMKLLKEERTSQVSGYKNILEGILTIRLGCHLNSDSLHNIKLKEEIVGI